MALDEGRVLDAIRSLRESEGIDLTLAKARVDAYVHANPALQQRLAQRSKDRRKGLVKWVLIVDAVLFGVAAYWFFGR
jgi:hypothetical protein